LARILYGLGQYAMLRGGYRAAHRIGERILRLIKGTRAPEALLLGHGLTGFALAYRGEFTEALDHLRKSLAQYDQPPASLATGMDIGAMCHCYVALVLWMLGDQDESMDEMGKALELADELAHPHTLTATLAHTAGLHLLRREPQQAKTYAEKAVALCMDYEFPHWRALSEIVRGWALSHLGQPVKGVDDVQHGLDTLASLEVNLNPYTLALLAESYGRAGQVAEGLSAADQALTDAAESGLRAFESMALRIKGDLLQAQGASPDEAVACYQAAIDTAEAQGGQALRLQAALHLSRLWQHQGRRDAARRVLAAAYQVFEEGIDAPDLQAARALLDKLGAGRGNA